MRLGGGERATGEGKTIKFLCKCTYYSEGGQETEGAYVNARISEVCLQTVANSEL